jgi:hypothetical protein
VGTVGGTSTASTRRGCHTYAEGSFREDYVGDQAVMPAPIPVQPAAQPVPAQSPPHSTTQSAAPQASTPSTPYIVTVERHVDRGFRRPLFRSYHRGPSNTCNPNYRWCYQAYPPGTCKGFGRNKICF